MPPIEPNQGPDAARSHTEAFWVRLAPRNRAMRWRFPRVHANVPVRITAPPAAEMVPVDAVSNDVSVLGLQVRCDRRTVTRLRPDPKAARSAVFGLRLDLVLGGSKVSVLARGRLAHITLVPGAPADSEVAMGFELTAFAGRGKEVLERFVSLHLAD